MAGHVVTDYAAAASVLGQAGTAIRAQGRLAAVAAAQTVLAFSELERGAWDAALEAAEEGLALTRESGSDEWLGPALTVTSTLSGLHGDDARADRLEAEAARVLTARADTNILGVLAPHAAVVPHTAAITRPRPPSSCRCSTARRPTTTPATACP